ncbi:ABC transporter ATP-binding protein [Microbacterium album]|uniref:ABC transporter ATP-binding protein n=1 Tax=Microbacterium album TaxID=2053191 RepID=A0A917MLI0_9MICO|nr:ABC transporter ATP-binding protein [Microbacterium album]GGH41014.1 ABC transporter ATP-binding protein [Microbacterium album]
MTVITPAHEQGGVSAPDRDEDVLLRVENLECVFPTSAGDVHAVSNISFEVRRGEVLALVGESGCGKSTTGRAIMQLPPPTSGSVIYDGTDLTKASGSHLRRIRRKLQIIFQDPISALNPRRKVKDIIAEGLDIAGVPKKERRERVEAAMRQVGLDIANGNRRPREFSGGQCQRIAIARAIVLNPDMLICDEPVASLDVSIQAQILNLLEEARKVYDLSLLFISHDLAVVHSISDRIAVMYLGRIVEIGDAESVYRNAAHPYTNILLDSAPALGARAREESGLELRGEIPSPLNPPSGCRFRTRCPRATSLCAEQEPPLTSIGMRDAAGRETEHQVACHFPVIRSEVMAAAPERPATRTEET